MKMMVSVGVVAALVTAPMGQVFAKSVCYWDGGGKGATVFRIAVAQAGTLTTRKEAKEHGEWNPRQKVYSVRGLLINEQEDTIGFPTETLSGSVIVGKGMGTRMGFTFGFQRTVFSYTCASNEPSATPKEWTCDTDTDEGIRFERVDPPSDIRLCSIFVGVGEFLPDAE